MNSNPRRRFNFLLIPFFGLLLPGLACLGVEAYNQYFRNIASPFLACGLGLVLLSLFFLIRRRKAYFILSLLTLAYIGASLTLGLWGNFSRSSVVQCYRNWKFDTQTGRIHLERPLGRAAPPSGAYISCNFAIKTWRDYLDNQPNLCTAFTEDLKVSMYLNDHDTDGGILREVQLNQFQLDTKSLLGEPLNRGALRVAFIKSSARIRPIYRCKAIYQVFEREIEPGQSKIIESFTRDGQGNLKSFTESSALNLPAKDLYAAYNAQGVLTEIPRLVGQSFVFPAKVDVSRVLKYDLPRYLYPGVAL